MKSFFNYCTRSMCKIFTTTTGFVHQYNTASQQAYSRLELKVRILRKSFFWSRDWKQTTKVIKIFNLSNSIHLLSSKYFLWRLEVTPNQTKHRKNIFIHWSVFAQSWSFQVSDSFDISFRKSFFLARDQKPTNGCDKKSLYGTSLYIRLKKYFKKKNTNFLKNVFAWLLPMRTRCDKRQNETI